LLAAREIFFCRGASATPSDRIKNRTTHQHLAKWRWYESADTMPPAAAATVCGATKRDVKRIARQYRLCIFKLAFGIPRTPSGQGLYSRSSADESGYRLPWPEQRSFQLPACHCGVQSRGICKDYGWENCDRHDRC
jgi:hypothetical protein